VDTSYRELARFSSAGHRRPDFHEVLLTEDGTLLVNRLRDPRGGPDRGGWPEQRTRVRRAWSRSWPSERRLLWEWRSLDHVGFTETVSDQLGSPFDYFHINGIEVTATATCSSPPATPRAVQDRPADGKGLWRLGGKRSDFSMGKGTRFGFQHDARLHEGGRTISLFDNGPRAAGSDRSRGRSCSRSTSDAGR
jgi:hypothetical protein